MSDEAAPRLDDSRLLPMFDGMGYRLSLGGLVLLAAALLGFLFAFAAAGVPAHAQQGSADQGWEEPDRDEPGDPGGDDEAPEAPDDFAGEPDERWDEPILPPAVTTKTVAGRLAMLRTDGKAAIPRGAPKRVRVLIREANRIIGKPYRWGGGHLKLSDRGYDCSGAVSFALIKAKMLRTTMVSVAFTRWGAAGAGRWISVYARKSHVYMEVAGLRLDTSSVGDVGERTGVRWRPVVGKRSGFTARHPVRL
jgi:hypothetical protein